MKIYHLLTSLVITLLFFTACQKELSLETGTTPSAGTLQSDVTGDCLPKTVVGVYEQGEALDPATDYIDVSVDVIQAGSYTIYTDTVNGTYFRAVGTFTATGATTVRLTGNGTPVNDGIQNFTVTYGITECAVPITVQPAGSVVDAVFTLDGSGGDCMNYQLAGDYIAGVLLTSANTITINVNVTVGGTYSISTAQSNGISFSGSGTLTATPAAQTIVLTASGTPVVAGSTNFPINAGSSTCNFAVVVTATASTFDYFPRTAGSNWSYQINDDANDSLLLRAKPGTVTLGGNAYTIFEGTQDAASGFGDFGAYRKTGGDYHTYIDLADQFVIDNPTLVDYIFLKDNVPANTTWQSAAIPVTDGGTPFSFRFVSTIEQKDVDVVVAGTTYSNTIVVVEKYELLVAGVWTDITDGAGYVRSFYARNVGLIKQDIYEPDGMGNQVPFELDMRRYQIQ